jgi:hypothetical protein
MKLFYRLATNFLLSLTIHALTCWIFILFPLAFAHAFERNAEISLLPTISILSPVNNAAFAPGSSVTITTATSAQVTKVEFFIDSKKIAEDTSRPFTFVWSQVAQGSYTLTAKATNGNGSSVSAPKKIIIGNAPPEIDIIYPGASNIKVLPGTSVVLGASAEDDDGDISKVEFFVNGMEVAEITAAPYKTTWSSTLEGTYIITATATDNKGAFTESEKITIIVTDNKAPSTFITSPASGITYSGRTDITITAEANDPDGSIEKVEFYSAEFKIGEDTTYPYSFTWPNVPHGEYSVWTHAIDNEGDKGYSGRTYIIVRETNPNVLPEVKIESPIDGSTFNLPVPIISFAISATDTDGSVTRVELYNGGTKIGEDITSPYSINWENAPEGFHNLHAKVTDNLGGTNYASIRVNVVDKTNTPPMAYIKSPLNFTTFSAPATFKITAIAFDDKVVKKVSFSDGLIELGEDSIPPYTITRTIETPGIYKIKAFAFDNQWAMGQSQEFTIIVVQDNCTTLPAYRENGGYTGGEKVKNIGKQYECKPFPYSGWCNSAAVAYAPGTGTHWEDAWILLGSCTSTAREEQVETTPDLITLTEGKNAMMTFEKSPGNLTLNISDANGTTLHTSLYKNVKNNVEFNLPTLPQGMYFLKITTAGKQVVKKYYIVK